MRILGLTLFLFILTVHLVGATPAPSAHGAPGVKSAAAAKQTKTTQQKKGSQKTASKKKSPAKSTTQKYKVRKGDNLYTIAHAHGMKLGEIKRLNGITDNTRLKPGQVLLVKGSRKSSGGSVARKSAPELAVATPSHGDLAETSDTIAGEDGVEPIARSYLSIPYRYGAESRRSTDCSGFTQQVFREFDIKLPRTAREQYTVGSKIDRENLQTGDLLFFRTRAKRKYPTHVGIYLGDGKMIHASSKHRKVVVSSIDHPYYQKRYIGAKRVALFLPGNLNLADVARQIGDLDLEFAGTPTSDTDSPLAGQGSPDPATATQGERDSGNETAALAPSAGSEVGESGAMGGQVDDASGGGEEGEDEGMDDIDSEPEPDPEPETEQLNRNPQMVQS